MANEVAKKEEAYKSELQKVQKTYLDSVVSSLQNSQISLNTEQKQNVMFCIQKIDELIKSKGMRFSDINQNSITQALQYIAINNLSCVGFPAEAYTVLRGNSITVSPQGVGWQKIVSTFGRDVKHVYEPWLVREKDRFVYPHHKGAEITRPEWDEGGGGKVIRVVYCIELNNGKYEYKIAERADVVNNLVAAISNNLIKDNSRNDVLKKCEGKTLEQILADKELCFQETMIITKMEKNALNKFPLEYKNQIIADVCSNNYAANDDFDQPTDAPAETGKTIDLSADVKTRQDVAEQTGEVKDVPPSDFRGNDSNEGDKEIKEEAKKKSQSSAISAKAEDYDDLPF